VLGNGSVKNWSTEECDEIILRNVKARTAADAFSNTDAVNNPATSSVFGKLLEEV
jgi:hypothetical protein